MNEEDEFRARLAEEREFNARIKEELVFERRHIRETIADLRKEAKTIAAIAVNAVQSGMVKTVAPSVALPAPIVPVVEALDLSPYATKNLVDELHDEIDRLKRIILRAGEMQGRGGPMPFDTTSPGIVNPPGTVTGKFLQDNNTWGTPSSGGGTIPYTTQTYASTFTAVGGSRNRIAATGNITLAQPSSPSDGMQTRYWITPSGAYTISMGTGIVIPTASAFSNPFTMTSGRKVKVMLEYDGTLNGGQWELTSFINGY
jgi:hypothetical protein